MTVVVKQRRTEILKAAIGLIADEGYANLSMRALAREVGMKLASLQYHFRSWDDLLQAIVSYVSEAYGQSFAALKQSEEQIGIREIVIFILIDETGANISGDRLWPQLWAMQQVEPLVSDLVDDIYSTYLQVLEQALRDAGASAPHAEALLLMSMLEGSTIFVGEGRRWQKDVEIVRQSVLEFIGDRYGESKS